MMIGVVRITQTIAKISEQGIPQNKKVFRKLDGKIYEIKDVPSNIRVYCAFQGKAILLISHGTFKVKEKELRREIDLAK